MGINPGKLKAVARARTAGRVGGFVGRSPRHFGRAGRDGTFAGRGNAAGAAARPTDLDDLVWEAAGTAVQVADSLPEIHTTAEPTYSEFLEAYPSPIGNGEILFSGTDPVDPGDCDRYPDSPLCGGSVVDPGGIGLYGPVPLTGGIEVRVSPTEVLISLNTTLFGIPLPQHTIGFRVGGAKEIVEEYWRLPPATITPGDEQFYGNPGSNITWITFTDSYQTTSELASVSPSRAESQKNVVYSHLPPEYYPDGSGAARRTWAYLDRGLEFGLEGWGRWKSEYPDSVPARYQAAYGFGVFTGSMRVSHFLTNIDPPAGLGFNPDYPPWGEWKRRTVRIRPNGSVFADLTLDAQQGIHALRFAAIPWNPPPPPPPPPPLPPRSPAIQPEEEDPMACDCKKIEKLLQQILALLNHEGEGILNLTPYAMNSDDPPEDVEIPWEGKGLAGVFQALSALTAGAQGNFDSTKGVAPRLGVDALPWNLPISLGKPPANGESESIEIADYANLQIYLFQQLSEMLGQTEIKVKVKDSDLTEEGDQELELIFPNISEALAELAGMAISSQAVGNATLKAAMTAVAQAGMAATSAATANQHAEEIQDFLGYKVKRDVFEMPLAYTPGETAPDKMLVPSMAKLSYWNNTDRNNLQSHMSTMEFAAAIIRAALFERIGDAITGPDLVKERVRETAGGEGGDFDTFLERVEQGYTGASGNTDQTPYGRPFDERPRIRKIGTGGGDDGSNT